MTRYLLLAAIALSAAACGPNYEAACTNVLTCQGERVSANECVNNERFTNLDPACAHCLANTQCFNGHIDCNKDCTCETDKPYGASVCR
jgi:hypothetical protein